MAEDDPDDRFLVERAFGASGLSGRVLFVEDGEELLDYLFRRARYADTTLSPRPSCILLDLNMPRKDGREALWEIRENPEFGNLPVIVLTTSDSQHDKEYCAELGVSDYVTKPGSFTELIGLMKKIEVLCLP
jgi:CheY-like chemotaxis protein